MDRSKYLSIHPPADLKGGDVAAIRRNVSGLVQQVLSRDSHVMEHGEAETGRRKKKPHKQTNKAEQEKPLMSFVLFVPFCRQ